jgi:hypothetical protein
VYPLQDVEWGFWGVLQARLMGLMGLMCDRLGKNSETILCVITTIQQCNVVQVSTKMQGDSNQKLQDARDGDKCFLHNSMVS